MCCKIHFGVATLTRRLLIYLAVEGFKGCAFQNAYLTYKSDAEEMRRQENLNKYPDNKPFHVLIM